MIAVCAAYVFLSATQDIAVDAVAVRLLSDRDRGTGNGIQIAASYLGTLVGGGLCVSSTTGTAGSPRSRCSPR